MFVSLTFLYLSHLSIHASPLAIVPGDGNLDTLPTCTCPDQRSVWDIIWSCLATIFACSWVSVHPNMPEPDEAGWAVTSRKLELMFWGIIAPELTIYWAVRQWHGARRLKEQYRGTSSSVNLWNALLINCVETDQQWTATHGHFIQMGGFMLYSGQDAKGTLSPERLKEFHGKGIIQFPTIKKEEIQDRSKGDALSKGLVVIQTTWFIIQCIARKAEGLDTTQIELLTLALAALNGVMYFLWWDKPLDVRWPVPVQLLETPSDWAPSEQPEVVFRSIGAGLRYIVSQPLKTLERKPWYMVPCIILFHWPKSVLFATFRRFNDFMQSERSASIKDGQMRVHLVYALAKKRPGEPTKLDIPPLVLGTVFGAIHSIGWFYTFPTHTEALLWRVCSVLGIAIPGLFSIFFGLMSVSGSLLEILSDRNLYTWLLARISVPLIATLPVYILARLGLLVEAVISLRALPSKAYANVEWTSFLPHI
ncbi:hypothetical protein BU17DRAFT_50787 [Hysterangium stoloniferum]|nr:hypothetical protein BU17DRAFT_50787 [Hysterangium stoloniferum]